MDARRRAKRRPNRYDPVLILKNDHWVPVALLYGFRDSTLRWHGSKRHAPIWDVDLVSGAVEQRELADVASGPNYDIPELRYVFRAMESPTLGNVGELLTHLDGMPRDQVVVAKPMPGALKLLLDVVTLQLSRSPRWRSSLSKTTSEIDPDVSETFMQAFAFEAVHMDRETGCLRSDLEKLEYFLVRSVPAVPFVCGDSPVVFIHHGPGETSGRFRYLYDTHEVRFALSSEWALFGWAEREVAIDRVPADRRGLYPLLHVAETIAFGSSHVYCSSLRQARWVGRHVVELRGTDLSSERQLQLLSLLVESPSVA